MYNGVITVSSVILKHRLCGAATGICKVLVWYLSNLPCVYTYSPKPHPYFSFHLFLLLGCWLYPNPIICPICSSHLLSSRRIVAFGGWHGGRRRAWTWWVCRNTPSVPVTLFPLPGASSLPTQKCLCRRSPGHGLWLQLWDCNWGQAKLWQ